jgi:signal peptidase II
VKGRRAALAWFAGAAALVLLLDQATKLVAWRFFADPRPLGPITFRLGTNTGTIWGLLPGAGALFAVLTALLSLGIIYYATRLHPARRGERLGLALALGGGLGNLLDRLARGGVTDFIDVGFWPTFNLADAAITIGVIVLLLCWWRRPETDDA